MILVAYLSTVFPQIVDWSTSFSTPSDPVIKQWFFGRPGPLLEHGLLFSQPLLTRSIVRARSNIRTQSTICGNAIVIKLKTASYIVRKTHLQLLDTRRCTHDDTRHTFWWPTEDVAEYQE